VSLSISSGQKGNMLNPSCSGWFFLSSITLCLLFQMFPTAQRNLVYRVSPAPRPLNHVAWVSRRRGQICCPSLRQWGLVGRVFYDPLWALHHKSSLLLKKSWHANLNSCGIQRV
jgi:hypothetical protein